MKDLTKLSILFMMDSMAGSTLPPMAETDPLNEDLGAVDPSFPLFAAGQLLEWRVTESMVKPSNDPSKSNRWTVTLESMSDSKSVEGTDLKAGTKMFLGCNLQVTGKSTVDIVKKSVAAQLQLIAGKDGATGKIIGTCEQWAATLCGNMFRAKTKIRPEKGEYRAQNELVRV